MDPSLLQAILDGALLIGYGLLLCWFLIFVFAGKALFRLHHQWFELSRAQFNLFHYQAMGLFKILIMCFLLAPYLSLLIIRSAS